jgi:hypothetical protein
MGKGIIFDYKEGLETGLHIIVYSKNKVTYKSLIEFLKDAIDVVQDDHNDIEMKFYDCEEE